MDVPDGCIRAGRSPAQAGFEGPGDVQVQGRERGLKRTLVAAGRAWSIRGSHLSRLALPEARRDTAATAEVLLNADGAAGCGGPPARR